jgi:rhodanese-related sulfurtransferase
MGTILAMKVYTAPALVLLLVGCTAEASNTPVPAEPAATTPSMEMGTGVTFNLSNVDATAAADLLGTEDAPIVLDVRTPDEYAGGHIEGALNIDFNADDFEANIAKLDRDKTYLVHCRSGGRSTSSLPAFEKLGFKSVIHLDGGMNGWTEAGKPVIK